MGDELLECGRVMKLHSLNAAQWNDCIVAIIDQAEVESTTTKYACEVILGEKEGKLIKVKRINLKEIPFPSEADRYKAQQLYELARAVVSDVKGEADRTVLGTQKFEHAMTIIKTMITLVPNCCIAWHLLALSCKCILLC